MLRPSNDPTFFPPPESLFQRRPLIDPGVLALFAALAALALLVVLLGLMELAFQFRLGDVVLAMLDAVSR